MIVDFMSDHNPYGKWYCIATKNLAVAPQKGATVRIKEEGCPHTMVYKVIVVEFNADVPKYIVYLS